MSAPLLSPTARQQVCEHNVSTHTRMQAGRVPGTGCPMPQRVRCLRSVAAACMGAQGAGQQAEESPSAPAELQLQDQAVQQCCTEFLAATAVPATPAMSAPACCLQPQHTLAQQQQCASAGDMAGAGIETAGSTELPQGLARQDSLLLRQASCSSCVDAMQYIAAVVRAVLKLYTTLVHRCGVLCRH